MKASSIDYRYLWVFFFLYKLVCMLVATQVVARITTLGDSARYIEGPLSFSSNFLYSSTEMMDTLASSIAFIAGGYASHLFFLLLSCYGIYYSLRRVEMRRGQLVFLLVILSTPTFSIWTSIVSKESVMVFSLGLLLGNFFSLVQRKKFESKISLSIGMYLLIVFKPHYVPAVLTLFLSVYPRMKLGNRELYLLLFFVGVTTSAVSTIFYYSEIFDHLAIEIPKHFSQDASGTRDNWLWVSSGDFLRNAPEGMVWALVGPFFSEAQNSTKYLIPFVESCILIFLFFYSGVVYYYVKINYGRASYVPVSFLIVVLSFIFMAFVHYPFGVLNPGSALRYRSGFFSFYAVLVFYCYLAVIRHRRFY